MQFSEKIPVVFYKIWYTDGKFYMEEWYKFQVVICVERKDGKGEFILDGWSMKA